MIVGCRHRRTLFLMNHESWHDKSVLTFQFYRHCINIRSSCSPRPLKIPIVAKPRICIDSISLKHVISLGNLDVIYIFIFMLGLLQTWLLSISEQGLCLTHLSRMAAVSSQLSTAGFCKFLSSWERRFFADIYCVSDKAPVTKTLMVAVSCSHIATHIPSFAPFFRNVFTGCQGFHTQKILM